ncbi:OLC1v1036488C1 [Oldenlandia corymbosa var. corymbosa]|uniref:OLC1v1036488C1 n=1 Tax=Oldenlandia corymbosa var. corymbosa TaxID=529605 RepID=A0AAV1CWP7_OLDCO|nr:OLC1v1036488C1 [Oldenlandia corymbosa var. corymbosa]
MTYKATYFLAVFLLLNLVFFTGLVTAFDEESQKPELETQLARVPAPESPPGSCPRDALELRACINVPGLVRIKIGTSRQCCSLLDGLSEIEVAACLCTNVNFNLLGITISVPLNIPAIINGCDLKPGYFQCP